MAKRLKVSGPSQPITSVPSNLAGMSPVAQMLQQFATGGGSPTKGLTPLGDIQSIGANNAGLNQGLQSTSQNRMNAVSQIGSEALRRTESAMAEERAKQEAIKQQAFQAKLAAEGQAAAKKLQDAAIAASKKQQSSAIAAQQKAVSTASKAVSGGSTAAPSSNLATLAPVKPKTAAQVKAETAITRFPPAVPPKPKKSKNVNLPGFTPKPVTSQTAKDKAIIDRINRQLAS